MIFNVISMTHRVKDQDYDNESYPFEKKQKLADKISVMTDKPTLRKIRDIIKTENPEATSKKNSNGYLMYFQNYTDDTYVKIEKLLNKIEKDRLEQQTRSITEMSDNMLMSSDDPNTDYTLSRTRLRYSNREKRLIKRQQYEDVIHDQQIDSENESNTKIKNLSSVKTMKTVKSEEHELINSKPTRVVANKTTVGAKTKPSDRSKSNNQAAPTIFSKISK